MERTVYIMHTMDMYVVKNQNVRNPQINPTKILCEGGSVLINEIPKFNINFSKYYKIIYFATF